MNDCMVDLFNQIADEAGRLTVHSKRATLTAREVQVRKCRLVWGPPPRGGLAHGGLTFAPPLAQDPFNFFHRKAAPPLPTFGRCESPLLIA